MKTKAILFTVLILLLSVSSEAAFRPLEISYPKTAGSGSPAIPTDHPVFRAYTNIEYNIRASVIGGEYPFEYSLSNAPAGMTIDSSTGEISWTPSSTGTFGPITLSVTDDELTNETSSWSIVVGTSNYLFVNSAYSGTETGSITQPFSSIINMLNNTTSSNVDDIVYFRAGSYTIPVFQPIDGNNHDCNMDYDSGRPTRWIAYPGESVTIDADTNYLQGCVTPWYIDDINFVNIVDWLIHEPSSARDYTVIRRCVFNNADPVYRTDNANQGTYYTSEATAGYYMTWQDNEFLNYEGVQGIGSLYLQKKLLIEDNYFHDFTLHPTIGNRAVVAIKYDCDEVFIRHNNVVATPSDPEKDGVAALGLSVNSYYSLGQYIEISFNHIQSDTVYGTYLNHNPTVTPVYDTMIRRNTFNGTYPIITGIGDAGCYGPFTYKNNVIINENNSGYTDVDHHTYRYPDTNYLSCVTITDDLTGNAADSIIDASGNLIGSYRDTYLGLRGWELADITNPSVSVGLDDVTTNATYNITGTATATAGRTISNVTLAGYTVIPDDGAWNEQVESFSVLVNLSLGANVFNFTAIDSEAEEGYDSKTITRNAVIVSGSIAKGCVIKGATIK